MTIVFWIYCPECMFLDVHHLERRHECCTFVNTAWPLFLSQLVKTTSRYHVLLRFFLVSGDSLEFRARSIEMRRLAHNASPAGIMPGDANRQMTKWKISHDEQAHELLSRGPWSQV